MLFGIPALALWLCSSMTNRETTKNSYVLQVWTAVEEYQLVQIYDPVVYTVTVV